MLIGTNFPSGTEKVKINGQKVKEKLNTQLTIRTIPINVGPGDYRDTFQDFTYGMNKNYFYIQRPCMTQGHDKYSIDLFTNTETMVNSLQDSSYPRRVPSSGYKLSCFNNAISYKINFTPPTNYVRYYTNVYLIDEIDNTPYNLSDIVGNMWPGAYINDIYIITPDNAGQDYVALLCSQAIDNGEGLDMSFEYSILLCTISLMTETN